MGPMQKRGLRKAARLLGGVESLAWHLDVAPEELERWMDGTRAAPQAVMVSVIELLAAAESSSYAAGRSMTNVAP